MPNDFLSYDIDTPTEKMVDSGRTTSAGTEALIDSGQNFTSTVKVGDKVINTTTSAEGTVTGVTSDTELAVLPADLMDIGEYYQIFTPITFEARDLIIRGGNFKIGESEVPEQNRIIEAFPGEYKRTPLVGVGIEQYLNAAMNKNELKRLIKKELVKDGFKVDRIDISDDFSEIDIEASKN